jgi:hypothetical protein
LFKHRYSYIGQRCHLKLPLQKRDPSSSECSSASDVDSDPAGDDDDDKSARGQTLNTMKDVLALMAAEPAEDAAANAPRQGMEGMSVMGSDEAEVGPEEPISLAGRVSAIVDGVVVVSVRLSTRVLVCATHASVLSKQLKTLLYTDHAATQTARQEC